jgi:hypothetical protein
MEIKISTRQILKILYVISFVIFIGVCIEAGSFVFNAFFTMVINPKNASYFGLSSLYEFDPGYYLVELFLMSVVGVMRAFLFYLIVKILHDKKLNMSQPFNKEFGRFIFNVSYLALGIGLFSNWGVNYTDWFIGQGVKMPDIQHLRLGGADVWLFMGVTLFVIAHIFKRGIEIQFENELTI